MDFIYHESADTPFRIIPTEQSAVRRTTDEEVEACEQYRATLDQSKLLLSGPPLAYLFRELTWARFERAIVEAGGPQRAPTDPILDMPRARQIIRQCLIGWENPHPSWPKIEDLLEYSGHDTVVSMRFIGQMPPSHVSECARSLFRTLYSGKPNEAKGAGEIQKEVSPGN